MSFKRLKFNKSVDKVVIIGAFDRYNYGDNLMPILFEFFLKENYPDFFNKHKLVYAALTNSDLSNYKAKKTVAMSEVFSDRLDNIKAVISIGGEVLLASSSTLFLHMNHPRILRNFIKLLKMKILSKYADIFCKNYYNLPWEFPYVPLALEPHIKIGFNTVGGDVSHISKDIYGDSVQNRLSNANYFSVRDSRTQKSLNDFCSTELFPDSVITMSHFIDDNFLEDKSRLFITNLKNENYICFQATAHKIETTAYECKKMLKKISEQYGLKVKLCPIGYANGHNDVDFLREIEDLSNGDFQVIYDLNVYEIMSVIRYSKVFMGTSLHGVITALSFSVPHIGINRDIKKLDSFLADWGIEPSQKCYSVSEIPDIFNLVLNMDMSHLQAHSKHLVNLGLENNHLLVQTLGLDNKKD